MKTFEVTRNNDESSISGTGKVIEGSIFANGRVVIYWLGKDYQSFGFYDHYMAFYSIHVASHPTNNTEIVFANETSKPVDRVGKNLCRHCKLPYVEHPVDRQWDEEGLKRSCTGNLIRIVDGETE